MVRRPLSRCKHKRPRTRNSPTYLHPIRPPSDPCNWAEGRKQKATPRCYKREKIVKTGYRYNKAMFNKILQIKLNKNRGKQPFRGELFNIYQLANYAKILASEQKTGKGKKNNYLRERLCENEEILARYNSALRSDTKISYITPATEWVIDNFYLIEEHVQLARKHFPSSYNKELPALTEGAYKALPRPYGMVVEYIRHVDAQVDEESLRTFFSAYQEVSELKIGELWAVPIMLRLTLIENLRRIVLRLQQDQHDRELANTWIDRFEETGASTPAALVELVVEIAKSNLPLSSAFVSEFSKRLSSRNPSLKLIRNWFEQRLQEEGLSAEEMVEIENQNQAADQVSVSHSIKSLRYVNGYDWKDFVEDQSLVEKTLETDPAGIYEAMDFASRNHYRQVVETLARQSNRTEKDIARQAILLAQEKETGTPVPREAHVGYYLVEDGQEKLKKAIGLKKTFSSILQNGLRNHPLFIYAGLIIVFTLIATFFYTQMARSYDVPVTNWRYVVISICYLFFISQFSSFLVNWISTLVVRPDIIPRLDFSGGIPADCRTIVAIPTLITHKDMIPKLVSDLEIHYLANRDSHLYFALLTDLPDADRQELSTDTELLQDLQTALKELNHKYGSKEESLFYLFHRPRLWNPREKKWMGYERKRGKLMAFSRLLLDGTTDPFSLTVGNLAALRGMRYVITLDTDTQLPPCSAHKLVGTMAHILNRPVLDPVRNVVVRGYGIMQPRIAIQLESSRASRFADLFTDEVGMDPYTRTVSNVYQDLFHEGSFVGKGIYDLSVFEKVLGHRFPDNKILSHDLLESTYIRSGLIGDVEVYEYYPSSYQADSKRRHRWMRGDWQIIQWLLPRVPLQKGSEKNPLSGLSKWKIADNLRRSVVTPFTLLFVTGFFIWYPEKIWIALLLLLIVTFLPFIFTLPVALLKKTKGIPWNIHIPEVLKKSGHQFKQICFEIAVFPYDAFLSLHSIVCSLVRLLITHRHLLQWQTAEEADRTTNQSLIGYYRKMWFSPFFALVCFLLILPYPKPMLTSLVFLLAWLLSPGIAWFLSLPRVHRAEALTANQTNFLRSVARKTWYFFETFVCDQDSWLPPDNFQEAPEPVIATRTSPTNIGLALLANLSAWDLGYLSVNGVIARTEKTFRTLTKMKKYRGHLYNWYDTRTLEPLHPLYISTVDSGNLAGDLIALSQGLKKLADHPVYSPDLFQGLLDTIRVLNSQAPKGSSLAELERKLTGTPFPQTLPEGFILLEEIRTQAHAFQGTLTQDHPRTLTSWAETLCKNCDDHLQDLLFLFPWMRKLTEPDVREATDSIRQSVIGWLHSNPTLSELGCFDAEVDTYLKEKNSDAPTDPSEAYWIRMVRETASQARERIHFLHVLSLQSDHLARMDFKFLYREKKKLFTIGYNVMDQKFDASSYDMLASEARLCSYIAVAQGQVPMEHWFSMSRLVVLLKGKPVLLSWSGSMFEYLMPLLLMPSYEDTLLSRTYTGSVQEQIDYGRTRGVPWGISESGYNRPDTQFNYQYQAFGVPSLGLKRGLYKDLVVAPYATVLSLMVAPRQACQNLQRLTREGQEGRYGYYEAVDYTPSNLPLHEKSVTVYSFMAHHQGMSLVSLSNLLKDNRMQKRFFADPQMKAFELLLQEKVPQSFTTNKISDHSKAELASFTAVNAQNTPIERSYSETPDSPEVNLLSNGRYQVMLNTSGAGYSRWNGLAVTRWRHDPTSDRNGLFVYLRDLETGKYWSAGYQPTLTPTRSYEANFTQAYAEYRQRYDGLDLSTSVCVSPEDDVELRCLTLTNHSHKTRHIELTTFSEVVLAPLAADESHPVFSNLFVQTSFHPKIKGLFCTRRPRSEEERPPYLFHLMVISAASDREVTFETDRSRFIGRGNTLAHPAALESKAPLSGSEGDVLDPSISLRRTVQIPTGKSIRICIILGMAENEKTALDLAEKYNNVRMTDRAFELAWTHSQVVLYHLGIKDADAQLFQRLAGSLVYLNPALRADPSILKNNRKGQNGLWGYGISGDVPLVLVKISSSAGMDLARQLILAHAYWRMKGLTVELLILNQDHSIYRHPLQDELQNMIVTSIEASQLNAPGGIFIRPVDLIPAEDLVLLQAAAHMIFTDKEGTLQEQIEDAVIPVPHRSVSPTKPLPPNPDEFFIPVRNLLFDNEYGGFTKDGKEYVINLPKKNNTPAPWCNVIANPTFGTVVSESGGSYTWLENSHEFRLTPWYNDPVKDTSGEALYIRDEETGDFWSPTPLPTRGKSPYVVRHGFGYTVFEHTEHGIASELWVYVAMDAPVKFNVLKLHNRSGRPRRISMTGYYEWVLGDTRTRNLLHIRTETDPKTGVLFARNPYNTDFSDKIAFIDAGKFRAVTGDRREFIGRDGSLADPEAMHHKRLSGTVGAGVDPCGAVQVYMEMLPREKKKAQIILGCARSKADLNELVERYRQPDSASQALEGVQAYWERTLHTVQVETPDPSVNVMANGWLLYQTLSCRIWARTGFYQSGGAYGFRDQLQDVMALSHAEPALMRKQILRSARHQFQKGDVQHWWHPPFNRGIRTLFSDDYLWLPYVTHHYITTVQDTGILDEVVPFIEGRELHPGEESYYDAPLISEESASLYEHCVRSIRYGLKFGVHGLPLMGCGDWNDGMNLVGIHGNGESVWLAFFLYDILQKFAPLAERHGDPEFADHCREQALVLRENIRRHAWDGSWYRRAYFDDGTPLGSEQNKECMIDCLPQSWSVISQAGDPERSHQGMDEVNRRLVDRKLKMIRLFTPSFDTFTPSPGYIKGYVPGVRENGGQYTHGVIWTALAFALMGETDRAWELFDLLNPVNHGLTAHEAEAYKVEPYVVVADVYSAAQHPGRGGWSWYTGSSAWMYRVLIETLLGIERRGDKLELNPRMRRGWKQYSVRYRYYDTSYSILIKRITEASHARLTLDGELLNGIHVIPLVNDLKAHAVELWIL